MNFWFDHKCGKRRDDIKWSFKGKSIKQTAEGKFNQRLKEYKIMCNSKSPCFGTLEYTLPFIRNSFIRNLHWDGQIAKKLSILKLQRLRNL